MPTLFIRGFGVMNFLLLIQLQQMPTCKPLYINNIVENNPHDN